MPVPKPLCKEKLQELERRAIADYQIGLLRLCDLNHILYRLDRISAAKQL